MKPEELRQDQEAEVPEDIETDPDLQEISTAE